MRGKTGRSAFVVALAVVATACSSGGGHRTATSTSIARPVVVSTPPADGFLSAGAGSDVHGLSVWSWTGRRITTIRSTASVQCCGIYALSPDGTRLLRYDDRPGATPRAQVVDTHGRVLAQVTGLGYAVWADDSHHLCELRPHRAQDGYVNGPADLVLVDPGHGERIVGQVPGYGPHTGPAILRCSFLDDQAIVADNTMGTNTSITAVQLSTGRASTPNWAGPPVATNVVAISGNGRYALEQGSGPLGTESEIVETSTAAIVGHVAGQAEDISWNGHLVVVSVPTQSSILQVVDWRTGVLHWRSANPGRGPVPVPSAAVTSRPNSDDLALAISDLPGHDLGSAALWLVTPTSHKLLDNDVTPGIS
jgi:hypothetical protein